MRLEKKTGLSSLKKKKKARLAGKNIWASTGTKPKKKHQKNPDPYSERVIFKI